MQHSFASIQRIISEYGCKAIDDGSNAIDNGCNAIDEPVDALDQPQQQQQQQQQQPYIDSNYQMNYFINSNHRNRQITYFLDSNRQITYFIDSNRQIAYLRKQIIQERTFEDECIQTVYNCLCSSSLTRKKNENQLLDINEQLILNKWNVNQTIDYFLNKQKQDPKPKPISVPTPTPTPAPALASQQQQQQRQKSANEFDTSASTVDQTFKLHSDLAFSTRTASSYQYSQNVKQDHKQDIKQDLKQYLKQEAKHNNNNININNNNINNSHTHPTQNHPTPNKSMVICPLDESEELDMIHTVKRKIPGITSEEAKHLLNQYHWDLQATIREAHYMIMIVQTEEKCEWFVSVETLRFCNWSLATYRNVFKVPPSPLLPPLLPPLPLLPDPPIPATTPLAPPKPNETKPKTKPDTRREARVPSSTPPPPPTTPTSSSSSETKVNALFVQKTKVPNIVGIPGITGPIGTKGLAGKSGPEKEEEYIDKESLIAYIVNLLGMGRNEAIIFGEQREWIKEVIIANVDRRVHANNSSQTHPQQTYLDQTKQIKKLQAIRPMSTRQARAILKEYNWDQFQAEKSVLLKMAEKQQPTKPTTKQTNQDEKYKFNNNNNNNNNSAFEMSQIKIVQQCTNVSDTHARNVLRQHKGNAEEAINAIFNELDQRTPVGKSS